MKKTMDEKINNYNRQLQKIDFELSQFIEYGVAVFGQSRSGKTVASHLISGGALTGDKINGLDNFQVKTIKSRNAIIYNDLYSYSSLPNIFQVKQHYENFDNPNQKIFIIDTPGYGSAYGALTLLNAGYCHYRIFSKVKNMKFILCFDANKLDNTTQLFDTIAEFISYFQIYENKKRQIFKSCMVLINKVDEKCLNLNKLIQKLSKLEELRQIKNNEQKMLLVKSFIKYIRENDQIMLIEKIENNYAEITVNLMNNISKKTSWWSRNIDGQKPDEVQMSRINFSVAKSLIVEMSKNKISKQEIIRLIDYYNQRIDEIINQIKNSGSLYLILNQLVKDAMDSQNQRNFINIILQYVPKHYPIYDPNYQQQRKKIYKKTFKGSQQNSPAVNKTVKKFNLLKFIQNIKRQYHNRFYQIQWEGPIKRTIQITEVIKKIIGQLAKACNNDQVDQQVVYKYGYLIHRVITQANLLQKVFYNEEGKMKKQLQSAVDNHFITVDRPLKDFMGLGYDYDSKKNLSYEQILQIYVKSMNVQKLKHIDSSFVKQISQIKSDDSLIVENVNKVLSKFLQ